MRFRRSERQRAKAEKAAFKQVMIAELEVMELELAYFQTLVDAGWEPELAMMEASYQAGDDLSNDWFFRKFEDEGEQ